MPFIDGEELIKDLVNKTCYKTLNKHLVQRKMRGVCGKYIEDLTGISYEKSQLDSVPYENPEARNQKQDYILYKLHLEPSHTSSDKSLLNLEKLSEGVHKANALKPQFQRFPARSPPLFTEAALKVDCYMHSFHNRLCETTWWQLWQLLPSSIIVRNYKHNQLTTIFTVGDNMMTGTTQHCYYSKFKVHSSFHNDGYDCF